MEKSNNGKPVYGVDWGYIIKPRSEQNARLEEILGKEFKIPCEVEIFAEVLPHSAKEPEFDQFTIIALAQYVDKLPIGNVLNDYFRQYGFINVKYVSKEGRTKYTIRED